MKIPQLSFLTDFVVRIQTSTVLAPLLAYNIPISIALIICAIYALSQKNIIAFLVVIILLYIIFRKYNSMYDYWKEKDPNRLHTEDHIRKMRQIETSETKQGGVITNTISSDDSESSKLNHPKNAIASEKDIDHE